jgi:xanthine dehydrogenase small subunit
MQQDSVIRFVLDGEVFEVTDCDPARSVLDYLREDLQRCGTKEGCAEGDCGACTVVVGELLAQRLRWRSINACLLLLPMLHGKLLLTVESLSGRGEALHPVQQAMVDCHASQCGFCTPGFVMSLFALYKNNPAPERDTVEDALSGNLCRCTGYRPIVDAARQMYRLPIPTSPGPAWLYRDSEDSADEDRLRQLMQQVEPTAMLAIEARGQRFFAPVNRDQLHELLIQYPAATIVAGNTDVGLWINKQLRDLPVMIYLGLVDSLRRIERRDVVLVLGAMVSLSDAYDALVEHYPELKELYRRFASLPVRNAGTLGGNVANGSPIGDSMPALLALDTQVCLHGPAGARRVPLADFYLGYQQKDLQPGEWLESLEVPLPVEQQRLLLRSYKVSKRVDQDISALCAAFALQLDPDGVVNRCRVAFGGMAAVPARGLKTEATLLGSFWDEASLEQACLALAEDFSPLNDLRASAGYRMRVAQNLLRRFYLETSGQNGDQPIRLDQLQQVST